MGERAIENRIRKLMALEEQKKELETQIGALQEEIKKDMEAKGVEEMLSMTVLKCKKKTFKFCKFLNAS